MKKVFFYGDSNTYGYDPAFYTGGRYPRRSRWTTLLAERLEGTWEVAADGMPGRMIPRPGRGTSMVLDSLRVEMPVDLFAFMLGTLGPAERMSGKASTMVTSRPSRQ